jgi:DNA recombination protein RmuC
MYQSQTKSVKVVIDIQKRNKRKNKVDNRIIRLSKSKHCTIIALLRKGYYMSGEIWLYVAGGAAVLFLIMCALVLVFVLKNAHKAALVEALQRQADTLALQARQLSEVNNGLTAENMRLKTEIGAQRRYMEEKIAYIEQSKNEMALKFRDISNEILQHQSQQINQNQSAALGNLLNPFKEQLQSFKEEVARANTENIKNKSSFDEQFKNLLNLNQNLSQDAQNLTNALRGSKKMQGDWGELELARLLEVAGLQENVDYYLQQNFKTEDHQNLRPDVIVKLPNNRGVVVDSKVSLNDYMVYANSGDEAEKATALQKHIQCIKNHIDELSAKEYQKLLKEEALDYVVIFIPIESAFVAAIKQDATLYDYAYKKNIALTTPSSLLPILRTVENLWKLEKRNKHVQEIARLGGSLYDKLANFVEDMNKIDAALVLARKNYEQAISKLSTGKGNAVSIANKLKAYGAQTSKLINLDYETEAPALLEQNNDNSEEKVS